MFDLMGEVDTPNTVTSKKRKKNKVKVSAVGDVRSIKEEAKPQEPKRKELSAKSKMAKKNKVAAAAEDESDDESRKTRKRKHAANEGGDDNDNDDGSEKGEKQRLTADQVRAVAAPENKSAIVSVRQKKRLKLQQRQEARKDSEPDKDLKRNREYLQKWQNDRKSWKFEKLRQIAIQSNAFDDKQVDDEIWPIALEYLAGSKGAARAHILEITKKKIDELDERYELLNGNDEQQADLYKSTQFARARELYQMMT